jgi:transposase-like protein
VLGVNVALSEAQVHWRGFLDGLVARGMRGVEFIVSDDHAGLRAARRAVLGAATWQRCQFHLAANAIHHAPNTAIRGRIGTELRGVWNANSLPKAQTALDKLVANYRDTAPALPTWLEKQRSRGARRLHPATASPSAPANLQPHRARCAAGTQTPDRQGRRLP